MTLGNSSKLSDATSEKPSSDYRQGFCQLPRKCQLTPTTQPDCAGATGYCALGGASYTLRIDTNFAAKGFVIT
jgi:hypothetical protein